MTTYRRVTGPGYSCLCKSDPDPCPPCPTTEDRARRYLDSQRRFLVRSGAVKYMEAPAR